MPESKDKYGKAKFDANISDYKPSEDERLRRHEILNSFVLGHLNMFKPRREFNDLSLVSRLTTDKLSFNSYQPNDGDAVEGDEQASWRSRAMRPIARNKVMSIAAHATARLLFPKVFAYNEQQDEIKDAAKVMEDLMEWTADKSNYSKTSLYAVITALFSPASIIYTDYVETYRDVRREKEGKKWKVETILDEELSGFMDEVIPCDQLYIENFYEQDIQKQGFLIMRKVQMYSLLKAKYEKKYPNFKYVKPGVQIVYNDANQLFYDVYDTNMRPEMCEEITYWNRDRDIKIIMVNGVMLTDYDNPNPRNDKLYPFDKFGYETLDEGRCFYYKSLVFKTQQDVKIINTLYPMIIDGTYLSIMPPMVNIGGEMIGSNVMIPGAVTTISDPNSKLEPIYNNPNMRMGFDALKAVEDSLNETSVENVTEGQAQGGNTTAYEISKIEQNAQTALGLFVKMIAEHVKNFGKLRLGDILQYMTIGDVEDIGEDSKLIYRTFYLHNKKGGGKTHKVKFTTDLPEKGNEMEESLKTLNEQGGLKSKTKLFRVNPELFRKLQFMLAVSADVLNPMSEELERAFGLEMFDKAILAAQNLVPVDLEASYKDFVLENYPISKKDPDKYIKKQQLGQMPQQINQQNINNKSPFQATIPQQGMVANMAKR